MEGTPSSPASKFSAVMISRKEMQKKRLSEKLMEKWRDVKDASSRLGVEHDMTTSNGGTFTAEVLENRVVSVLKVVYILHKIPFRILDIKKLQAKLFIKKVGEVLRILEMEGTPCLSDQLVEEIVPLALPIEDFFQEAWPQILQSDVEYVVSTTTEVPEVIEQISLIENKLEKFLDETDFYDALEDLRSNLAVLPSRQVVRNVLQSAQALREVISFFHEVDREIGFLCRHLKLLRSYLNEGNCANELVGVIHQVADNPFDHLLRCRMQISRISRKLDDALFRYSLESVFSHSTGSQDAEEKSIEVMAKQLFEGKNGTRLFLLEALGKLHSIKGKIDTICEKPGREDLQSQNDPSRGTKRSIVKDSL